MKILPVFKYVIVFGILTLIARPSFASIITGNLLLNPGAENGLENFVSSGSFGFTTRSAPTNVGGFLDQTEGENFFVTFGGSGVTTASLTQRVDVSNFSFDGLTSTVLFGGDAFASTTRRPPALSTSLNFSVFFLDELNNTIGSSVLALLRGQTSPERVSDARREALVPVDTAAILFRTVAGDGTNSAIAIGFDDLHLSLSNVTSVPESRAAIIFLMGLSFLFISRRRKKHYKLLSTPAVS